ncbi:MAG: hypothetical protein PF489_08415 [Salinivirgaceae bacterium]|jgi:hypothetical protein|nr:hypothetical protein [Salinivirgaceae bacterium]
MAPSRIVLFFLVIFVVFSSCSQKNQGVIEYTITYEQSKEENPLVNLMPTQMNFYFTDDKVLTQIEGWMGIFKSHQLSSLQDSTNILLMKLLDKKFYFTRKLSEDPLAFEKVNILKLDYIEKDTLYKDYKCKQVLAEVMVDSVRRQFRFLYTNDIKVNSPNRNNPFSQIPGVLMKFNMNFRGIAMQMEFKDYRDTTFTESTFEIPADYKEVSREEMTDFFTNISAL